MCSVHSFAFVAEYETRQPRTLLNEVTKIHYPFCCRLDILLDGTMYARHLVGNLLFHRLAAINIRFKNAVYARGLAHITLSKSRWADPGSQEMNFSDQLD